VHAATAGARRRHDPDGTWFGQLLRSLVGRTTTDGTIVPPPNAETLFTFVVPRGTTEPGGYYHGATNETVQGAGGSAFYVPYIVIRQDHVGFIGDWDYLTWSLSHELVEAASNPRWEHAGWTSPWINVEGEIGDLCNDISVHVTLEGTDFALTRVYSAEKASARSGDPCFPALGRPYANVALRPGLVHVPSGATGATVRLVPFSYGAPVPMHWHIYAGAGYRVSPATGTSMPGDDVLVQVTRTEAASASPVPLQVWVSSPATPDSNIPEQEWFGGVVRAP
jgi:hypothetical protein